MQKLERGHCSKILRDDGRESSAGLRHALRADARLVARTINVADEVVEMSEKLKAAFRIAY